MGKRNRPSSGSSVSAEESSPSQRNPPPTKKMAAYKETDAQVSDLSPELQKLASVILQQTKQQQEAVGDRLSNQIQSLSAKVEALSTEVGTLRERVMQLEKAADFHAGEMTTLRDELRNETRERVKAVLLGERYSMKPDVIVRGIPYDRNEECSSVLANFLVDELHLDRMPTVAVHRLSKPTPSRPDPPLLARFVSYHDRDAVLAEGRKLRGNKRGLAVYEHLPPPIQAARSKLVPDRDAEIDKAKDHAVKPKVSIFVPPKKTYAVLLVNGKEKKRVDAVDIILSHPNT